MHEEIRRICDAIAAERDPMRIAHALYAGLGPLAHATVVALFVFDAARQKMKRHAVEMGREIPYSEFDLMELESFSARSARSRAEIHVDAEEGVRAGSRIPGTETTRSLWFGPMLDGAELMGVLSVQSTRLGAYGDAEKRMFRELAECVGRALAKARREAPGQARE